MRNQWHHKGLAEYMTKKRFTELGLTETAIGVRDRSFGTHQVVEEDVYTKSAAEEPAKARKKDIVTMAVRSCPTQPNPTQPPSRAKRRLRSREPFAFAGPGRGA